MYCTVPGRIYPDKAIVAEDDACPTGQLVKMGLPPLDQAGAHLHRGKLSLLTTTTRVADQNQSDPDLQ